MPARTAAAPWRIPTHFAVRFIPCLPEGEVANIFLVVFVRSDPPAGPQFVQVQVRELSIIRKFIDAKIDRLVVGLISQIARHQLANHFDHARDIARFSRSRELICALEPQGLKIFEESLFKWLGVLFQWEIGLVRTANRFVIDIGKIHHPMHAIAA